MNKIITVLALSVCCIFFTEIAYPTDLSAIRENLGKDLKFMVPEGAGGLVGLFKRGEKPQFITLGTTSVIDGKSVNKNTLTLVAPTAKDFGDCLKWREIIRSIISSWDCSCCSIVFRAFSLIN